MAGDGTSAIGDLRWATSTNVATYYEMDLEVSEHGKVEADPLPMASFTSQYICDSYSIGRYIIQIWWMDW